MTDAYNRSRLTHEEACLFRRALDEIPRIEDLTPVEWATLRGLMLKGFATISYIGQRTTGEPHTKDGIVVRQSLSIGDLIANGWIERGGA